MWDHRSTHRVQGFKQVMRHVIIQLALTVATNMLRTRRTSKAVLPLLALARDGPELRLGIITPIPITQDTSLPLKVRRKPNSSRNHNQSPLVAPHVQQCPLHLKSWKEGRFVSFLTLKESALHAMDFLNYKIYLIFLGQFPIHRKGSILVTRASLETTGTFPCSTSHSAKMNYRLSLGSYPLTELTHVCLK